MGSDCVPREAMDSVQRQHQLELRNHRHSEAMQRHHREVAKAWSAQAQRAARESMKLESFFPKTKGS